MRSQRLPLSYRKFSGACAPTAPKERASADRNIKAL
jgi:hypothetical protein